MPLAWQLQCPVSSILNVRSVEVRGGDYVRFISIALYYQAHQ